MSTQVHAPPTAEEYRSIPYRTSAEVAEQCQVWREERAEMSWCSACRVRGVPIVHMGIPERNFGICGECLARLAACLASVPP